MPATTKQRARALAATSIDPDVRLLQALGDPVRLAIVRQLAAQPEVCACDFTSCCDVSQPTISHHLKVLREAGIVESERRGTWVFYRVLPDVAARLQRLAVALAPTAGSAVPAFLGRGLPVIQPAN